VAITLGASDVEGATLSYTFSQPAHGTLTGTPPILTYAPESNYSGPDSFTFSVSDGNLASAVATVSIAVVPVNDQPVALIDVFAGSIVESNSSTYVIVANNGGVAVALDGSRSSDIENDPLQYFWFTEGAPAPFAEGVRVTNLFAAGTHVVTLAAWDGEETGRSSVMLEIITTGQAVELLISMIEESDVSRNRRPLLASLKAASASFEDGRMVPGGNQLQAFQNKVRAQVSPTHPQLAQDLIEAAQQILDVIGRH
jgi:hypothetical protein